MIDFFKNLFSNKSEVQKIRPVAREKHNWQLISRSYASPVRDFTGINLEKLSSDLISELSLGVTTYVWECSLTGDIRTEKILGSDTDTLQDILQKVKMYGKQFVTDEQGIKYVIDVYFQPQDLTSLPVRK